MRLASLLLLLVAALGCGPKLPPRYVVEKDLGAYRYRRYQQVLDIEVPIAGNPAVGHTATYVRTDKTMHIVPVFVTAYEKARGLTETVRQRLRALDHYTFDVTKLEGEHVFRLRGESGDTWVLWVSGKYLVKIGVPEGDSQVPEEIAESYLEWYPSDLDAKGRAKGGAESAGPATESAPPAEP